MYLYKYGNESCFPSLVPAPWPAPLSPSLWHQFSLCSALFRSPQQPSPLAQLQLSLQQSPFLQQSIALYSAIGWLCQWAH